MELENNFKFMMNWTSLGENISVMNFPSTAISQRGNRGHIYVKKINALKNDSSKRITIFLLHDLGQYHHRFTKLIDWTLKNNPGVSLVMMDFAGHGLSSGTRGHFNQFDHLGNDFYKLLNEMKKSREDNEKWLILGHGLGGLVALDLLHRFKSSIEESIDGLILSNFILKISSPFLKLDHDLPKKLNKIKKYIGHLRPYRFFLAADILSSEQEILAYQRDPLLVNYPTLNSIRQMREKMTNIYQDSYFLEKPLMLLKSLNDKMVDVSGMSYFAKGIKKEILTEKTYSVMKYDLYNERECENIFADIRLWMERYKTI